jgi:saccharopine dehydrogenase-like NADP-dependent oxidoreductase
MASRIVLYGATGYTGTLTAQALVADGVRLVLAGRDQGRLSALAARLAQAYGGTEPETAVVDAERPGRLRDLLGPSDVLVSTAGPFLQVGRPIVAAAVDAGAVYLDSAGEPPFIRVVLTCSFAVFVWGICALTRSAGEARDVGLFRLVAVFRPWSRACGSGCFPAGPQAAASLRGRGQAGNVGSAACAS